MITEQQQEIAAKGALLAELHTALLEKDRQIENLETRLAR